MIAIYTFNALCASILHEIDPFLRFCHLYHIQHLHSLWYTHCFSVHGNTQWLTMRNVAPIITAFIFTSRSIGTVIKKTHQPTCTHSRKDNWHWIPKLSASVKYSLARPDHCFVILPTSWVPSADRIYSIKETFWFITLFTVQSITPYLAFCGKTDRCLYMSTICAWRLFFFW